jgi:hypothetical protein
MHDTRWPLAVSLLLCYGKQVLFRVISAMLIVAVVATYANTTVGDSHGTTAEVFLSAGSETLALGQATRTDAQLSRQVHSRSVQSFAASPWILPLITAAPPVLTTTWCRRNNNRYFQLSLGLVSPRSIRGPPDSDATFKKS